MAAAHPPEHRDPQPAADENHKPHSKVRTAISIIVPLLPIVVLVFYYFFELEFREYVKETAIEGFLSAKEDFEMLEFILVLLGGFVILVIFYAFYVLRIRKITTNHQTSILELINDEKSLIVVLLVMVVISVLIYAPYQEHKKDRAQIEKLEGLLTGKKSKFIESKLPPPLPDKTIPDPIQPTIPVVAQQPGIAKTPQQSPDEPPKQLQLETNSANNDDAESDYSKLVNEKRAARQKDEEDRAVKAANNIEVMWRFALPAYNNALKALYDVSKKEAEKHGDGIILNVGYFQSVPQSLDSGVGTIDIASIRFQNKTNVFFQVSIEGLDGDQRRILRISSSDGYFILRPDRIDNFYVEVHTPDYQDIQFPSAEDAKAEIDKKIKFLIVSQLVYSDDKGK